MVCEGGNSNVLGRWSRLYLSSGVEANWLDIVVIAVLFDSALETLHC